MRIKEIMERVTPAYDPDAGFLRNVGRAGLNRFVRGQLGTDAYSDEEEDKKRQERAAQREVDRQKAAANQAAREIDQANVPAGGTAPQTSAANTQSVAPAPAPAAPAQTTPAPNFGQGGYAATTTTVKPAAITPTTPAKPTAPNFSRGGYAATTTNAPTAAVPAIPARPTAPAVNPTKPPQVYTFDGRALNPGNANDARIIKTLQSQGVTSGRTNPKPSAAAQNIAALQDLRQTAIRTGDRNYLRQINQRLGLPPDSTT
jgi:hypothetical protein